MTIYYEPVDEGCLTNQNSFERTSEIMDLPLEKETTEAQSSEEDQVTADEKVERQREREYPDVFYCPITKSLLKDAVVIPDGNTFERSAIEEKGDVPSDKMYVNRALIAAMEETTSSNTSTRSMSSLRSSLRRMGRSLRQNIEQYMDDNSSILSLPEQRPLPESYYCPITFNLMHEPVIDADGNTFERAAVVNWIVSNGGTSPITRNDMSVEELYPNNALRELMDIEKGRSDSFMHRSVRRWKEESPPEFEVFSKAATTTSTGTANDLEAQMDNADDEFYSGIDEEDRRQLKRLAWTLIQIMVLMTILTVWLMQEDEF